jgi:hypothetical protein
MRISLVAIADQSDVHLWGPKGWAIFGIISLALYIWLRRADLIEWLNRDGIDFDSQESLKVPCPPEHGAHCRCTWY